MYIVVYTLYKVMYTEGVGLAQFCLATLRYIGMAGGSVAFSYNFTRDF